MYVHCWGVLFKRGRRSFGHGFDLQSKCMYLDSKEGKLEVDFDKSQRLDYVGRVRPLLREPDFHKKLRQVLKTSLQPDGFSIHNRQ